MARQAVAPETAEDARDDHLIWVRTRLWIDMELKDAARHGFSLIATGFGSFSVFEGLTVGERHVSELPRTFALIVTAAGVILVALAVDHYRKMTAWIDADEFGAEAPPTLPDEKRPFYVAVATAVIGVVSLSRCCGCRDRD
jgi:hypothetical protein